MPAISIVPSLKSTVHSGPQAPSAHRAALIQGFRELGVDVLEPDMYGDIKTKNVACWGWKRGELLKERGYNVLVMERGYVGDRFLNTSLGWNGLNNYATFPKFQDDGGERFRSMGGVLKPWKSDGQYILILGQVRGDASLQGKDIAPFYRAAAIAAKKHYGLPVYFRAHPDSVRRGGYRGLEGVENYHPCDLSAALSGALFTIAYNSNSCLDSVLAGVPCYAGDKGTMAWPLCFDDLKQIQRPAREYTAHQIAWTQWTPEELRSGEALKRHLECMV